MLTPAVHDDAIRAAVQELFAPHQRRLLGSVLTASKPTDAAAPLKETFPAALREVLKVNSAGEGSPQFEAFRANPRLQPLVNADAARVVAVAGQAVAAMPNAEQSHQQAVTATFSRKIPRPQTETVVAARPPVSAVFFKIPGLVGQA